MVRNTSGTCSRKLACLDPLLVHALGNLHAMPWAHLGMLCKQAISQAGTLAITPSCVPLVPFTFTSLSHLTLHCCVN